MLTPSKSSRCDDSVNRRIERHDRDFLETAHGRATFSDGTRATDDQRSTDEVEGKEKRGSCRPGRLLSRLLRNGEFGELVRAVAGGSPTGRIGPAKYNSARVILLFMNRLLKFAQKLDLQGTGKWLLLSAAVGIVAGLGAIAFQGLLQIVQHFGLALLAGYAPPEAAGERALFAEPAATIVPWMIVPIMAIGGLISGWLVYTFAPEAEGHGTDAAIDARSRSSVTSTPVSSPSSRPSSRSSCSQNSPPTSALKFCGTSM